jgi:hypothetical protein
MSALETAGSLLTGIKTAATDKTGNNRGFDSYDAAGWVTGQNQMIGQAIEGMEGRWTTIRPP